MVAFSRVCSPGPKARAVVSALPLSAAAAAAARLATTIQARGPDEGGQGVRGGRCRVSAARTRPHSNKQAHRAQGRGEGAGKRGQICEEPQKGARERSHWVNRIVRGSVAARYYLVASKSSAHFDILALTFFDDIPRLKINHRDNVRNEEDDLESFIPTARPGIQLPCKRPTQPRQQKKGVCVSFHCSPLFTHPMEPRQTFYSTS